MYSIKINDETVVCYNFLIAKKLTDIYGHISFMLTDIDFYINDKVEVYMDNNLLMTTYISKKTLHSNNGVENTHYTTYEALEVGAVLMNSMFDEFIEFNKGTLISKILKTILGKYNIDIEIKDDVQITDPIRVDVGKQVMQFCVLLGHTYGLDFTHTANGKLVLRKTITEIDTNMIFKVGYNVANGEYQIDKLAIYDRYVVTSQASLDLGYKEIKGIYVSNKNGNRTYFKQSDQLLTKDQCEQQAKNIHTAFKKEFVTIVATMDLERGTYSDLQLGFIGRYIDTYNELDVKVLVSGFEITPNEVNIYLEQISDDT